MQQAGLSEKTEHRPIQAIKELVIRGSADVFVKRGEPSMTVTASNPEDVITEIRSGVLTISTRPTTMIGGGRMDSLISGGLHIGCIVGGTVTIHHGHPGDVVVGGVMCGQRVAVEITLPELPAASIEGSGDLNFEDLCQDEIELAVTGAGTIRATGRVNRLAVAISGSGNVNAKNLVASIAEFRISGAGDIKAQVTQSLTARVSGVGNIKVWGNPAKRDTRVSGCGDICFK